ncbi:DUF6000 family protein [Flavilitoribacter nigricans]|uniref:Uncharacterized protein n=1 Tax=Flavilitoribacter nigricans (strain ATCC 23147 / DSM 23189 / NBRC 102662 / NCIMB 1420 / SS-2) TaxID=1122177 RepID=A0A2D0N2D8_FLAN2|nr:DUF6000 family protein [Flavilitoribacter nigricans]PHN02580.1 hypothetical protein CRP01_31895 [Flavilitoribacter nigricans DSM 23189 = NBRC 102662]
MNNRFPNLTTYKSDKTISEEFRMKWVSPYYLNLGKDDNDWIEQVKSVKRDFTEDVILKCIGGVDWRSRQTGAYFAAINNLIELTDIIGVHLLKSEVCFAGKQYAITLAMFNTEESIKYLSDYLDYYLQHPELEFDQIQVFEALKYLDEKNQTNYLLNHKDDWNRFGNRNIEKFENILLINHSKDSKEYNEAMEKITNVWSYSRPSEFVRKRIQTITKIKEKN